MSRVALLLVVVLPPVAAATAFPVPRREGPPITCEARRIPFPPPPKGYKFDPPVDDGLLFEVRLTNRTPHPIRLTAYHGAWGLIYPRVMDAHGKEVSHPMYPFVIYSLAPPLESFVLRPGVPLAIPVHALTAVPHEFAPAGELIKPLPGRYQVVFRFREPRYRDEGAARYESAPAAFTFEVPAARAARP